MDISFLLFLQNIREKTNGLFDSFFLGVSNIAVGTATVFLFAIVYWGVSKRIGTLMLLSDCINFMVCGVVKTLCAVRRPWVRSADIHIVPGALAGAGGYSFPSGHTTGAVSSYGVLSLFGAKSFRICMVLLVALVMFSRMYLGCHTPQDVIVGALISVGGIYMSLRILDYVDKNPNKDIAVAGCLLLILTLFLGIIYLKGVYGCEGSFIDPHKNFLSNVKYSALQYGAFISWVLERRFVNFSTDGTIKQRIIRVILGMIGLFAFVCLGKVYLNSFGTCGKFLNIFLTISYVVYIFPLLIKKLKI